MRGYFDRYFIVWNFICICVLLFYGCASLDSRHFKEGLTAYEAKDYDTAMDLWRPLAGQGNAKAQFNIGVMYNNGQGVDEDPVEALVWYRKAADQGHVKALFNIGDAYRTGRGVDKNMNEAVNWYQKAADLGYSKAQYAIGLITLTGQGVPKDERVGMEWILSAAKAGYPEAEFMMGRVYLKGLGEYLQNKAEAIKWFRKAAENGHRDAEYALGLAYDKGQGVDKDPTEAANWYRRAGDIIMQKVKGSLKMRPWRLTGFARPPRTVIGMQSTPLV